MIKKIGLLILSAALLAGISARAELADRIVAVVGNQVLTQSELDQAYSKDLLGILKSETGAAVPISRRDYLEKMIEKMLIDQEVKKEGISVSVLEVEQAIDKKSQELGMSQMDFLQALRSQGLTMDQYRDKVKENLVLGKLISKEVRSEIEVSDQEIALYYQQRQTEFKSAEKIHLYHLVIRKDPDAELKIEQLRKEYLAGTPFPELARKNSQGEEASKGGDLGWVEVTALKPALSKLVEPLELNQISPVYADEIGFHLFWIQGREQGIQQSLDLVRAQIRQILERKQFDQYYQVWLQRLKAKAYIEIRL